MSSAARAEMTIEHAPQSWFAVQTRYRFEKKVAGELTRRGMQVFLPLRRETRCWGDRQKEVLVPVFPGYAFVLSDRSVLNRLVVLQTAGVMGFASAAGTAATVPQKQIEDLRRLIAQEVPSSSRPFVASGQRVRIRGGRLDGLEGLATERKKTELVISIEAIHRSLAIDIQTCKAEVI
jgi:transcription antitermination factor NusG